MLEQFKTIIARAPSAFVEDAIGLAAIFVMLMVGLSVPSAI